MKVRQIFQAYNNVLQRLKHQTLEDVYLFRDEHNSENCARLDQLGEGCELIETPESKLLDIIESELVGVETQRQFGCPLGFYQIFGLVENLSLGGEPIAFENDLESMRQDAHNEEFAALESMNIPESLIREVLGKLLIVNDRSIVTDPCYCYVQDKELVEALISELRKYSGDFN